MSHFTSGLIGAAVATIAFGAAQLAMGSDVAGAQPSEISQSSRADGDVNRSSKSDRMALNPAGVSASKTVSVRLAELPNTSVLIRIPAVVLRKDVANTASKSAAPVQPASARRQVACEPVVSVLTEVAKLLQPGRCVT